MFALSRQICFMRFFRRVKAALANAGAINHDLHTPFALMTTNAQKPGLVGLSWLAHVLQIAVPRHLAKVVKLVVLLVAVFVVNVHRWLVAGHVQPRQSMCQSFFIVDCNRPITGVGWTARLLADKIGALFMCFPNKSTCFEVVVKQTAKMVNGNHELQFTIGDFA